jgi:pyruvate kinase
MIAAAIAVGRMNAGRGHDVPHARAAAAVRMLASHTRPEDLR